MELLENEYISTIVQAISYLGASFILFMIGKMIYQLFHPSIKVNNELLVKDNFAFSLSYVGYFVGLTLAIGSTIIGPSNGLVNDIIDIGSYGLIAIILLNIGSFITDKFVLPSFSLRKEIIEDKNAGTGLIEGANSIASGLIIFGAVSGEGHEGFLAGIISAVTFWAVGQVAMVIVSKFYNAMVPYNVHDEIEKDNVAAGIGFAGALVAIGNIIRFGLMGDFEGWGATFIDVGFELLIGLMFLPIARLLADKILLPGVKLTDEIVNQEKPNMGAALVEAFAYISGSVMISWCL